MKIIFCEADYGYGNCDSCGYSGHINVHTYDSISELLKHQEIRQQLIQAGWIPLQEAKDIQNKIVLDKKLYIADDPDKFYAANQGYHMGIREFNPNDLNGNFEVNMLARGTTMLVQKVDPKSILSPEHWRMVEAGQKRIRQEENARKKKKKAK